LKQPQRQSRIENLPRDFFKDRTRHFHELLARWRGQFALFTGNGNEALNEDAFTVRQNGGRTTAAIAELRHRSVLSDYFLDLHGSYVLALFFIFRVNQNCGFWFTRWKGAARV
jgi:hypothetical protein